MIYQKPKTGRPYGKEVGEMENLDEKLARLMDEYVELLIERMKKPETSLMEVNDGIRLITRHFEKLRNVSIQKDL